MTIFSRSLVLGGIAAAAVAALTIARRSGPGAR